MQMWSILVMDFFLMPLQLVLFLHGSFSSLFPEVQQTRLSTMDILTETPDYYYFLFSIAWILSNLLISSSDTRENNVKGIVKLFFLFR